MSDPKRFEHLERGRERPLEERVEPGVAERFGAVEQGGAPVPVPSGASVARFDPASGPDEVAVEPNQVEEQPFVVCARCGLESGKFAQACPGCGAGFDTAEQRAHNARVWAARRSQQEAERAQAAAHQEALLDDAREAARQRHELGVELAREVKQTYELEHRSLDLGTSRRSSSMGSPLLALLGMLPGPWGAVVGLALVLVPLGLVKFAARGSTALAVGAIWLGLDLVLAIPPGWWTRGRYRWWSDD
jgi:hypothetical protein